MKNKKSSKKTTTKAATKSFEKETVNFDDTIKTLKTTVKTIGRQLEALSDDVIVDALENGEIITKKASKKAKSVYSKVSKAVTVENITKTTKNINNYTVKTTEDIVDEMYSNGQKWQKVGDKAIKGSLKLAAKQQDLIFDTLDTVKDQLTNTASRITKVFSNN